MTRRAIKKLIKQYLKKDKFKEISTGWVMTSCPFAEWLHADRDDKHFSFGISTKGGFNCFTCGMKGSLLSLPKKLSRYTHQVPYDMFDFIKENLEFEDTEFTTNEYSSIDDSFLTSYREAPEILSLTKEDIQKWNIKTDESNRMLLFPIYDRDKKLTAVKVRHIETKMFYYLFNNNIKKSGIWYGENFGHNGWLALVEGERDAILLSRFIPAWACLGTLTKQQLERIKGVRASKIILFFDNDTAGQNNTAQAMKALGGLFKLYTVADYHNCKDPAEMVEKNYTKLKLKRV